MAQNYNNIVNSAFYKLAEYNQTNGNIVIDVTLPEFKLRGGSATQVLATDGDGSLSWVSQAGGDTGQMLYNNNDLPRGITGVTSDGVGVTVNQSNIHITGGSDKQFLQTDGTGNVSWQPATTAAANALLKSDGGNVVAASTWTEAAGVLTGPTANLGNMNTGTATVSNSISVSGNLTFTGASANLGSLANLHITGGSANYVLATDGAGNLSWYSGVVLPGGSNTQVQFNDGGAFAGSASMTFDKTTGTFATGPITSIGVNNRINLVPTATNAVRFEAVGSGNQGIEYSCQSYHTFNAQGVVVNGSLGVAGLTNFIENVSILNSKNLSVSGSVSYSGLLAGPTANVTTVNATTVNATTVNTSTANITANLTTANLTVTNRLIAPAAKFLDCRHVSEVTVVPKETDYAISFPTNGMIVNTTDLISITSGGYHALRNNSSRTIAVHITVTVSWNYVVANDGRQRVVYITKNGAGTGTNRYAQSVYQDNSNNRNSDNFQAPSQNLSCSMLLGPNEEFSVYVWQNDGYSLGLGFGGEGWSAGWNPRIQVLQLY